MLEESRRRFLSCLYFLYHYQLLNQKVNKFPLLLIHVDNYKGFARGMRMFAMCMCVGRKIHLYCHGEQTDMQYCCLGNSNIPVLLHFKALALFTLSGITAQPKTDWLCGTMTSSHFYIYSGLAGITWKRRNGTRAAAAAADMENKSYESP